MATKELRLSKSGSNSSTQTGYRLGTNTWLRKHRVNAGTVVYGGYDARYDQGNLINADFFPSRSSLRTNHTVFTKLQYLLRF